MANVRKQTLEFYINSRDSWKQKVADCKKVLKYYKIRVRDLEKSRSYWKMKALNLIEEKKKEKSRVKIENNKIQLTKERIAERSPRYSFCNFIIFLSCNFFLSCCTSYRGCSKILYSLSDYYSIQTPHYNSIRIWILKLGFFKLTYAKMKRDDWIFIIDFTITIGIKKCMVILGTPLSRLEKQGFNVKFEDVEILHLSVSMHYTYKEVEKALTEVANNVGTPVEIISDYGSDVKKGIDTFCKKFPKVHFVYDITHLLACILKKYVENDQNWSEISKKITSTIQQTKQSLLSFLSPPSLRKKSRFLNLEGIIKWSKKLREYIDNKGLKEIILYLKEYGQRDKINKRRKFYTDNELPEKSAELFDEKFGWINQYKDEFEKYSQYMDIISIIKKEIGENGLSRKNIEKIEESLSKKEFLDSAINFKNDILKNIKLYLPTNEKRDRTYLGKSDIIESLFGKYKYLSNESKMLGITESVLIIPSLTGKINTDIIKQAMENVKINQVKEWSKKNIGETVFSKRKKLMTINNSKPG
jgi:hypothetical protein